VLMAANNITFPRRLFTRLFRSLGLSSFPVSLTHAILLSLLLESIYLSMAKTIALVIQEDPRRTHRPVEALRIALGLVAGSHETTVVLLGEAVRLLSDDIDDIVDVDILEKYLPSVQHLEIPFILESQADRSLVSTGFRVRYESEDVIRSFVRSVDRTLIF
jgi:hypothetical protein